jgi:hypothetical protein
LSAKGLRGVITEAAHVFCEELTIQSIRKARTAFLNGNLRKQLEKDHGVNTEIALAAIRDDQTFM